MTKYLRMSAKSNIMKPIKAGFQDRNTRKTTAKRKSDKLDLYFNIHELRPGESQAFFLSAEEEDFKRIKTAIRKEVSAYSIYVGIYCNVEFYYDSYNKKMDYIITNDGRRYK